MPNKFMKVTFYGKKMPKPFFPGLNQRMHAFCMPFPERLITISGEVSFKIVKRLSSVKGVFMLWWVSIDYRVKTE